MYSFKKIEVPDEWIFRYYLNITQPMTGDQIGPFFSVFKQEKTPSMSLYLKDGKYRYKDFSSGNEGDAWDLAGYKEKGNYRSFDGLKSLVSHKYYNFIKNNGEFVTNKIVGSNSVMEAIYETRDFNEYDHTYWFGKYNINRQLLESKDIRPLSKFQLIKKYTDTNFEKTYPIVEDEYIYGYFDSKGLNTIYQPLNKSYRFIKLRSVIYGEEDLTYSTDVLIIGKAKKDITCMEALNIHNVEYIAIPNEVTLIKPERINFYKGKYYLIITILDNDTTGIKSMHRYYKEYGIPFIHCPYQKDISDFIEMSGQDEVKSFLIHNIQKKLNNAETYRSLW